MSKLQCAILTAALVSTAPACPARHAGTAAAQGVEAEIRATHDQMKRAAEKLDAVALYAYVLDSVTPPIIEDGQVVGTRAAALERTTTGFRQLTKLSYAYTQANVTVISTDIALWVAEGTATATLVDGRTISAPFAETIVFSRQNGHWRVLHAHRSAPNEQ